jgi:hypothetical protein
MRHNTILIILASLACGSNCPAPTLTQSITVNNDSGYLWSGYQVNVIMSVPFTFVSPGPSVQTPTTDDWYVAGVSVPTLQVSGPYSGLYEGTLYYSAGTPIGIGGELDFVYSIHFASSTDYSFTQQMIAFPVNVGPPNITITNAVPRGSALISSGTGGVAGAAFHVFASTNVATPMSNWLSVGTGTFVVGGNFTVTNAVDAAKPVQFFRLRAP